MMRWLRNHFDREMIRPLIHKVFARGILALFAAQMAHFFLPAGGVLSSFSGLSLLLGFIFALSAVIAWLRLDGMKIPWFRLPRMKRKDPPFLTGNMADHMDDDIVTIDDLDPEEQNTCVLLADLILAFACFLLAAFL